MDEDSTVDSSRDVRDYLRILRRRRLPIIGTVVVVVVLAVGLSLAQAPVYAATAQVLVPQQPVSSALNPGGVTPLGSDAAQRALTNELMFARGDAVKQAAQHDLGYPASATISASAVSDLLSFTAHSGQRAEAQQAADAYAAGFIRARRAQQVDDYAQKVTAIETTIRGLQTRASRLPSNDVQIAAIQESILSLSQTVQQLQAASQLVTQTGASVVTTALRPVTPISPKPVRNGALGVFAGLVLGVGLALLLDRLDDSVKSREDLDRSTGGLPLIGLIPTMEQWKNHDEPHVALVEAPTSHAAEAYRSLRTSVQFLGIDRPARIIGITSPGAGDGKTTTTANLAVSFARAAQRVIVVSGDLRRPRLHSFFGQRNDVGLTSVLLGHTVGSALQNVEGEPNLRLLASGPIPPNPAELLSLARVSTLIHALADDADLVIIDCPPTLPVTDTLLLSRLVDGMLIVTSAGKTKVRDLTRTCELLRQVGAPLLGTILNQIPQRGGYSYDYGYYSDPDYRSDEPTPVGHEAPRPGGGHARPVAAGVGILELDDRISLSGSGGPDLVREGQQESREYR